MQNTIGSPDNDPITVAVVEATRRLIIRSGTKHISMAGMAREVGVSRPTLYARFPNVGALVVEVLAQELVHILEDIASLPDTRDELVEMIVNYADRVRTNDVFMQVVARNPEILTDYFFERLGASQLGLIDYLTTLIRRVQDHDPEAMSQRDPARMATVLVGIVQTVALDARALIPVLGSEQAWREETLALITGYLRKQPTH